MRGCRGVKYRGTACAVPGSVEVDLIVGAIHPHADRCGLFAIGNDRSELNIVLNLLCDDDSCN